MHFWNAAAAFAKNDLYFGRTYLRNELSSQITAISFVDFLLSNTEIHAIHQDEVALVVEDPSARCCLLSDLLRLTADFLCCCGGKLTRRRSGFLSFCGGSTSRLRGVNATSFRGVNATLNIHWLDRRGPSRDVNVT